ncbi:acyl-CoA dehydrogenase family protein [Shouchella tritolerans]|uniref:acyl-CoA dehydrogenase family protein n=1 Tax=Shouchella tritolerans TaxID=2979466 RepID=UPI0021E93603|nr:acyl-CoA dehydrogenase family protein [Shouchella tritolerans]
MSILDEQSAVGREQALRQILKGFSEIGAIHDHEQTVPIENIAVLKESGYTALPVETKYGGRQISLSEMLFLQQLIAEADGPTALCIGWHMGTMYQLAEEKIGLSIGTSGSVVKLSKKGFS